MLVQTAKVGAFDFGRISAGILFCEVDLSAYIVFLEILPKATQNGVVQDSVESIVEFLVEIVFPLVMQESYMRILMRFTDFSSKSVLTDCFS